MADSTNGTTEMSGACSLGQATGPRSGGTVVVEAQEIPGTSTTPILKLRLKQKSEEKKTVAWTSETVDNEHLGRKKSKCCCIFVKQKAFGQSDSEDDSDKECEHCTGHVEKKK